MSTPGLPANPNRRQKRMGPAPFASFEDLSDELESPEDKNAPASVVRLPGIREDVTPSSPAPSQHSIKTEFIYTGISLIGAPSTPTMTNNPILPTTPLLGNKEERLQALTAPRIDISRASSSSHHDSRDSSPEKEKNVKISFGFREEGTKELRTSTEELDFQDRNQQKVLPRSHSPVPYDDSYHSHNRKDSQSSEIGLLCISGRTSRLSSIGSQGSAHSRVSNASHLSVISNQSGVSRSPSPHKMLLETSFCGTKPQHKDSEHTRKEGTKEDMELVLLKRKHDPTKALLAEGIEVPKKSEKVQKTIQHQPQQKSDITITIDKPTNEVLKPKLPKRIVADSGVEYIYIPLKGPLPEDNATSSTSSNGRIHKHKVRETKSASLTLKTNIKEVKPTSKSASPSPMVSRHHYNHDDEPKYIRIKLKPDYLYDESDKPSSIQKPDSLDLNDPSKKPVQTFENIISYRNESPIVTPLTSPRMKQHLKEPKISKSPSPSLSRKSSFTSIFKSKETISPESPLVASRRKSGENKKERRRSRSKSRDRTSLGPSSSESIDSKGKPKSVFSIFKSKKTSQKELDRVSPELPNLEGLVLGEYQNNGRRSPRPGKRDDQSDKVRIPLHSPTYYEQKHVLQECKTSSQDSQDTVIEVAPKVEQKCSNNTNVVQVHDNSNDTRQNSTSSENLVFSTKLGSNNEIFTTKLPKDKVDKVTMAIVETKEPVLEENEVSSLKSEHSGNISEMIHVDNLSNIKRENSKTFVVDEDVVKLEWSKPEIFNASPGETTQHFSVTTDEHNLSKVQCDNDVVDNIINRKIEAAKEDDRISSESERDVEVGKKDLSIEELEPERKGFVLQQDSFEDELPYVPTTLPLERSVALPIIPIKQRSTFEIRTYPIERPRSTTPINPTCLEDYCEDVIGSINLENITNTIEKLKISLPRDEDKQPKVKSPRRTNSGTWFDFSKMKKPPTEESPPPLPPKGVQKEWINFEEIPEKRKAPKRIQTIPSRSNIEVPEAENVIYTYVNPEDCKCECHERSVKTDAADESDIREDEMPLLENDQIDEEKVLPTDKIKLEIAILDRRSTVSDSSVDLSIAEHVETNGIDNSIRTPFTSDLGISSNRSSVISQDVQSPDTDSTNAFPKNH